MRTIEPILVLAIRDAIVCSSDTPSVPYLPHPMDVCRLVLAAGGSQISACAAVLHEVVASGRLHLSSVEQRYGQAVAERVQLLCRQVAEDEEGLLLLCADRVAELVRWGHKASAESLASELNALHLRMRLLSPCARQVLARQLESLVQPVVPRPRRTRARTPRALPKVPGVRQQAG